MKIAKLAAAALFVFLLLPAASQAATREIHVEFYSDAALNNQVGDTTDWCDNSETSWGNVAADYIGHYEVSCSTGEVTNVSCHQKTEGGAYAPMDCYWDPDQARIRIPVGGS